MVSTVARERYNFDQVLFMLEDAVLDAQNRNIPFIDIATSSINHSIESIPLNETMGNHQNMFFLIFLLLAGDFC